MCKNNVDFEISKCAAAKQRFSNANKNRHSALCLLFRTYATIVDLWHCKHKKVDDDDRGTVHQDLEVPFEALLDLKGLVDPVDH